MHEWSLTMFIELEEELLKEVKKSKIRRKNLEMLIEGLMHK